MNWTIAESDAGQRLDTWLAARLEESRNRVHSWFAQGRVIVDGEPRKPSHRLAVGEHVECSPPAPAVSGTLAAEAGELSVLYEDADLIAIDKPAGITVHPGAGRSTGTLVHRLLHRYPEIATVGGQQRPGIVHRLDKDTTGVLLIARSSAAYRALATAFAERTVRKTYLAIAYGTPKQRSGSIAAPVGRHPQRRKEMTVRGSGRPAETGYQVLAAESGLAFLELDLRTGRTHQIRVHLKAIGHPLVGDPVYGENRWKGHPRPRQAVLRDFARPALHAWRLALAHPLTGEALRLESALPADLAGLWRTATGTGLPPPIAPLR
jgi:23S rRNA pseudouridine1911/1915/1917 synthase